MNNINQKEVYCNKNKTKNNSLMNSINQEKVYCNKNKTKKLQNKTKKLQTKNTGLEWYIGFHIQSLH